MKESIRIIALLAASLLFSTIVYSSLSASPIYRADHSYQQSLPVDKQKTLTTYGPDDIFPTQTNDRKPQQRNQRNKKAEKRQAAATRSAVNPAPVDSPASPAQPQQTTATVEPSPLPTPSATPTADISSLSQEVTSQQPSTRVSLQMLGILIFLVSTALIFVIFKLMAKFREGSS